MCANERLTMIEQIAITFFAEPDLFLELACLRDPDNIYDHRLKLAILVKHGMNAMEKVLYRAILILQGFGPFHHMTGASGFFKYHTPCSRLCHRTAGILTKLFVCLTDHPFSEMLIGDSAIVRIQKTVSCIRYKNFRRNLVEDLLKKVAFQLHIPFVPDFYGRVFFYFILSSPFWIMR